MFLDIYNCALPQDNDPNHTRSLKVTDAVIYEKLKFMMNVSKTEYS